MQNESENLMNENSLVHQIIKSSQILEKCILIIDILDKNISAKVAVQSSQMFQHSQFKMMCEKLKTIEKKTDSEISQWCLKLITLPIL